LIDRVESLYRAASQAFHLLADRAVSVNPWWLAAGVVVYELSQVVRTRGWFNVIRAAYPDSRGLRARDVTCAYLAGSGLNSCLPARSGDFLKLFLVHRRLPSARYATLAATFGPEALPEFVFGTVLVIWALAHGLLPVPVTPGELPQIDVSFVMTHPLLSALVAGGVALAGCGGVRWVRRRAGDLAVRLKQGFAIVHSPRRLVIGVAGPQLLSRVVRLGGLVCFMAAFGLPVTPSTALLAMAAQGAGRLVPVAPVSAGLRVAMLSYAFVELTDTPVDVASITAFWFAVGALHLIASVLIALVSLNLSLGTLSPGRALAAARRARAASAAPARAVEPAPAPAPEG
jgi:Lysylphosphatidylglycerol synthase TM region